MEIFLHSTLLITLGEMGDKTQLLAILLVARYQRVLPLLAGIVIATLLNHALAVWVGAHLGSLTDIPWVAIALPLAFIAIGLWMLHPDSEDSLKVEGCNGAFITALTAFFMAEMGDKTQVATVALAAEYHQFWPVLLGTTCGMMLANAPALWLGRAFLARINVTWMHRIAALLFIGFGLVQLIRVLVVNEA